VKDIKPGAGSSGFCELNSLGNRLYFSADDGAHGHELWVTDGTPKGTTLFKDIYPGEKGALQNQNYHGYPLFGGRLFFWADDGTHGVELWITDGTPEGTTLLKDIYPGTGRSGPNQITSFGGRLFFSADDGTHGLELWVTDGTPEGTRLFKDINPGNPPAMRTEGSQDFVALGDRLFFAADDGAHGMELWVTDGTPEGTSLVKDLRPGPGGGLKCIQYGQMGCGSFVDFFVHPGGTLFFTADDGVHGYELWALRPCPERGDTR